MKLYNSHENVNDDDSCDKKGSLAKIRKPFSQKDRLIFATSSKISTQEWIESV